LRKNNQVSKYIIGIVTIVILASCGPKVVFEKTEIIKNPWDYFSPVTFEYVITDTLVPYDLQLIIGHSSDFTYENLYINATTIFPDDKKTAHPVSLQLTNETGNWLGDCAGDNCKTKIEISPGAYYKKTGKYRLIIEQYSRKSSLEGINNLTLKITELKKNK